jgi:GAF domain-containing protein
MVAPAVVALCHEYAALAGAAAASLADFLADAAELAVRSLPSAQSAHIRVRVPEVVTAIADAPGADRDHRPDVLAIPLVGGGDLAGVLELHPGGRDGFPADERELAEVLAVLLTLSLGTAA